MSEPVLVVETVSSGNAQTVQIHLVQPRRISLPWAVLVPDNQRHELLKIGKKYRIGLTARYRSALEAAGLLAAASWRAEPIKVVTVSLRVTLYEPDKRRRDIGNYLKLIADALTRVAFVDDSQIDRVELRRGKLDRVNPRAEIEVSPL